jgi:hypothetical protein
MTMSTVEDDFDAALDARWHPWTPGGGALAVAESALQLMLPPTRAGRYSDAQIDDYSGARRARFLWRPPLRLAVRARFSHTTRDLCGTAGFGFWNYPLTAAGGIPRLPDAVWFFAASPPSNMALVPGGAGWGWKAQVIHVRRIGAVLAGVPALGVIGWARLSGRETAAERWVQRVTGAREASIGVDPREWHDYALEWRREEARFWVDGTAALTVPQPPGGPLGFVAWIDNQYAVATPRGALRFGTLDGERRWIAIDRLELAPLEE